jgi:hypothetical protein
MLDAGCWVLDAGCWMLDAGCWMLSCGGCCDGGCRPKLGGRQSHIQVILGGFYIRID